MQLQFFVIYQCTRKIKNYHDIQYQLYIKCVGIVCSLFDDYEGQEGDGVLTACSQM